MLTHILQMDIRPRKRSSDCLGSQSSKVIEQGSKQQSGYKPLSPWTGVIKLASRTQDCTLTQTCLMVPVILDPTMGNPSDLWG